MKMLAFFFNHSRKVMLFSVIAGFCSGVCNAALLSVINAVVKRNGPTTTLLWSFGGLCVFLPIARFTSEILMNRLGQEGLFRLRMQLCGQILAAPLRHLESLGAPSLLAALTDDVPTITAALLTFPLLCVNISLILSCFVYIGVLSPILLVVVLGFLIIGVAGYQLPIIKVQRIFRLARKDADTLQTHFRALTQGAKELKMHSDRRRAFFSEGLEKTASSLRDRNISGQNLYSAAASWGQTLVFVVVGVILFLLPMVHHLTNAMMMAYALTLLYLMAPLQTVMNTLPQLSRANVALKKIEEIGFTLGRQGSEETAGEGLPPAGWNTLELRSVAHSYQREGETGAFVLGPINLSFRPGELVFIIGGNGSGKTTFVKLLTGLYAPEEGQIFLDGKAVEARETYRQQFSTVFADFYLFEQMLGLSNPQLDDQAREYLSRLNLSHKVRIVDGKLSTTDLSQGQRKRLALLTAYLEDRPIYVFDEWAADQDPQFKAVFYMELLPDLKARGKTVFVITHDDRYFHVADRIIKLEDGKIAGDRQSWMETDALKSSTTGARG
jgi:putative pyoverdin transport system ATP-binding/permease protein